MYQPLQSLVSWVTSERGIYILRRTGLAIQAICVARSLWTYHSTDKELVEARKEVLCSGPWPSMLFCWTSLTYMSMIPGRQHQKRTWATSYRDNLPSETRESPTSSPGGGFEGGAGEHGCFVGGGGRWCGWQVVYGGSSHCGYKGISGSVSRHYWGRRNGFGFVPLMVCGVVVWVEVDNWCRSVCFMGINTALLVYNFYFVHLYWGVLQDGWEYYRRRVKDWKDSFYWMNLFQQSIAKKKLKIHVVVFFHDWRE